jgi:hypothetical protein
MNKQNVFTRRRFIRSSFGVAATHKLQCAAESLGLQKQTEVCKLSAQQEIGPYYIPGELLRSDIVEGRVGIPLSNRCRMQPSICGIAMPSGSTQALANRYSWVLLVQMAALRSLQDLALARILPMMADPSQWGHRRNTHPLTNSPSSAVYSSQERAEP